MSEIVFTTIHGSRLYGFDHAGSDYDHFTVTESYTQRARQRTSGDDDHVTVGIVEFLTMAYGGSHQSVEALFSSVKQWGPAAGEWRAVLERSRVTGGDVFAKYERTIKAFCYGDLKRRRHAVRLSINLSQLREDGTIRPRLDDYERGKCGWLAEHYEGDELRRILIP